jgi:uncharacterized protein (DUF1330 family)
MAKGYWVDAYRSISDREKFAAYQVLAKAAVDAAGGRILARGGAVTAFESGVAERTVVVEFPSYAEALAAYRGDEYQRALQLLGDAVERDMRVVEGLD